MSAGRGRFADGARRLAGQAGMLLGWRADEFWRATPDELGDALGALRTLTAGEAAPVDRAALDKLMEVHPDA
jgi:uncharacterized phage protein (TIGR02216 family)